MKNQYFGDKRDLFKLDLWLEIAKGLGIKKHTFIPMLTPNDPTKQGGQIPREAGVYCQTIFGFLARCHEDEKRHNIKELRAFSRRQSLEYCPYRDTEYLSHDSRSAYFSSVPKEMLERAAILIDADIGLERKRGLGRKQPEKYVTCGEIAGLAENCSGGSVILVFQFLRGGKRLQCLNRMVDRELRLRQKLSEVLTDPPPISWVAEGRRTSSGPLFGDVAFFIIGAGPYPAQTVSQWTRDYADDRELLYSDGECASLRGESIGDRRQWTTDS
jgi:hypothetical protein